jgi:hypothetical protein
MVALMTTTAPVAVRVWPANFQFEPGYLRVTATAQRYPDNRWLDVVVDGEQFLRRTTVQLDGETAPITHQFEYRDVPAGDYVIAATVGTQRGERGFATVRTRVLSRDAH